ncbi:hypothetical protein ACFCYX_02075 [Streptomyces populi]|uniref:hypothetical protein n=1 Tax=Streptomyces populi TaxID=2058924 RepID=UPI0035DCBABE
MTHSITPDSSPVFSGPAGTKRASSGLREEIDRVVATVHAPLLADFRLIDTPGFNSVYGHDAAASLNLLTSAECDRADAFVHTIGNQELTGIGQEVAQRFVGNGGSGLTPMKALGVMPRINEIWPSLVQQNFRDPSAGRCGSGAASPRAPTGSTPSARSPTSVLFTEALTPGGVASLGRNRPVPTRLGRGPVPARGGPSEIRAGPGSPRGRRPGAGSRSWSRHGIVPPDAFPG